MEFSEFSDDVFKSLSTIPPGVADLNLLKFSLTRTKVRDLTPVAALSNLEELDLNNTQVSDLTPLADLIKLEMLRLDGTPVRDLLPLTNLKKLKMLRLNNTQVSDLAPLTSLTELENIRLVSTKVHDLTPLANLSKLQVIWLDDTQVSDVQPLAKLLNLQTLWLDYTNLNSLEPLRNLKNLRRLDLNETTVSDFGPLANLIKLETLNLSNTEITNLSPVADLKNLQELDLSATQIVDLLPLASSTKLERLVLVDTKVRDLAPLADLKRLDTLNLDNTQVADLRHLIHLERLGKEYRGLHFRNTPATARDGRLAELSEIEDDKERTRKTLEYLRSLPPWPEPYTPEYTPDGSPPQPIGGAPEADEVLVPAPVRAPLEVEVVDGRLRPARPGDGLGEDAHERARQAWRALRDFLADLADIRPRIVNQMPQLERALTRLEDALGDDYEAANPIAMGIHGERVIKQAGAAGETMADADAAELREFAAALSLFLERFPAWLAYRDEAAPAPPKPPRIEDALPEIEAITEELREHDAIDPAIPESLEKQVGDVRSNPEDSLAKRGLVDSLRNVLGRIGEAILAGGKWVLGEIVDIGGQYYRTVKSLAVKGAAGVTVTEITLLNRDLFAALAPRLHALAASLPEKFGWLKNFLAFLGL